MKVVFGLFFLIISLKAPVCEANASPAQSNTLPSVVEVKPEDTAASEIETVAGEEARAIEEAAVAAQATDQSTDQSLEEPSVKVPVEAKIESTASKEESAIPVLTEVKKSAAQDSSPWFRIIATMGVLSVVGVGVILYLKRHAQKVNNGSSLMQIKILTQHHLGPKKSLAVIRVAGESILIGITDQNISMIKALSLLDEELPEVTPQDFGKVMKQSEDSGEDTTSDEFAFASIKDKVSGRLKNMRSF